MMIRKEKLFKDQQLSLLKPKIIKKKILAADNNLRDALYIIFFFFHKSKSNLLGSSILVANDFR